MLSSPEWTRADKGESQDEELEPNLAGLVTSNPGATQIYWLLSRARLRALEQLEALTQSSTTADEVTAIVFKLAKTFTDDDKAFADYFKTTGVSEADAWRDTRAFLQVWTTAFPRLFDAGNPARLQTFLDAIERKSAT